ncbi:hypothetical protein [Luteococcus sediminum]
MSTSNPIATGWQLSGSGACLVGGSLCWVLAESLRALAGYIPDAIGLDGQRPAQLAAWRAANELTMLTLVLVPTGLVGRMWRPRPPTGLAWALGVVGALIGSASLLLLIALEGLLVYPIPELPLNATILPLVESLVLGARHLIALGWALATGAFTAHVLQVSATPSRLLATVGGLSVVCQLAGSFPWLCPRWIPVTASLLLVIWTQLTCRHSSRL